MARKDQLDILDKAEIDYSIPIDKFARKAKALLHKLAKANKVHCHAYYAEYSDGAAEVCLDTGIPIPLLTEFNTEVRKLVKDHAIGKAPLNLEVIGVSMRGGNICIDFC